MSSNDGPRSLRVRSRFSLAHVLVLLAGLLALLLNFAVLRSRDASVDVLIASRDLAPGQVVGAMDVGFASLVAEDELLKTLFAASSRNDAVGQILNTPLREGDLIRRGDVRPAATSSDLRAMSIPIDKAHASGGAIAVGDSVDVIVVAKGFAEYIAAGLEVIDLATGTQSGLGSGQFYVTVAVDSVVALELARAIDSGSIEILRSTGAAAPEQWQLSDPSPPDADDAGT